MASARRLRLGQLVRVGSGAIYRVALVNECRARLELARGVRAVRRDFIVKAGLGDEEHTVAFVAAADDSELNVSPTAIVDVLTPEQVRAEGL